jgi:hypothetical protein
MMYNTQDYWVLGLFPSSGILENKKSTMFRQLVLFPSSGEGGGKTPTQLSPLERANLNHWKPLCQSQSYVTTDGQSASLSWNKAPIWGLRPDFYYCQTVS